MATAVRMPGRRGGSKARRIRRGRRTGGVVLLAVLLAITLLSIMVVSFMASIQIDRASSNNFSRSVAAQEIAWGGLQDVLGDLGREMDAGSYADGSPAGASYSQNGVRIYIPVTNGAAMPARIGFPATAYRPYISSTNLPCTLVRVSRASDTFYSAPPAWYDKKRLPSSRASAVSSTAPSADGRLFSASRWNKPLLMGTTLPNLFSNTPPDWVYVTRSGSRALAASDVPSTLPSKLLTQTNQVLGRYAFVVYDTGALLDLNVAGFPSASMSAAPTTIGAKSYSAYADLTQLPGLTGKQTAVDRIVQWRNKGGLAAAPSYIDATRRYASNGFTAFQPGDNPLLGRQDMLRYLTQLQADGTIADLSAAAYFTTFSRASAAPSWQPVTPPGSTVDYAAKAETAGSANRNTANVRWPASAKVTHYFDDRSIATYQVKAGDPFVQSRFSLARIGWLTLGNPATGSGPASGSAEAEAIRACFGLQWDRPGASLGLVTTTANGGNACWNYVDNSGAIAERIKTLSEVAAEGREPNFFEMLKAGILNGSLGLGPGPAAFNNGTTTAYGVYNYHGANAAQQPGTSSLYCHTFGPLSTEPVSARMSDVQIMQIGANIIDQYDADSYPTAIYFRYQGVGERDPAFGTTANPIFGPVTMVYGTENLPYLLRMMQVNCSPKRTGSGAVSAADDATNTFGGWRQPELWNPHQAPSAVLADVPRNFQIRAYGSAYTFWSQQGALRPPNKHKSGSSANVDYFLTNNNQETCPTGTILFTDTGSPSSFYSNPRLLTTNIPGVVATSPDPINVCKAEYPYTDYLPTTSVNLYGSYNLFVAFSTGVTSTEDSGAPYQPFWVGVPDANGASNGTAGSRAAPAVSYALGWVDDGGRFHPYSYLLGIFTHSYSTVYYGRDPDTRIGTVQGDNMAADRWALVDPRTSRFGLNFGMFGGGPKGNNTLFRDTTKHTGISYGLPSAANFVYADKFLQDWGMNVNTATGIISPGTLTYYSDPDGVVRPGDAAFFTAKGDGHMLFTRDGTTPDSTFANGDKANIQHGRRPVILNRPFRSVGELGYVFRDEPFKSLDFFSSISADAALLDMFSIQDDASILGGRLSAVVAGQVNLSNAPLPVLQSILYGATKKDLDPAYSMKTEAAAIAQAVVTQLHPAGQSSQPLLNRADIVTSLAPSMRLAFSGTSDRANKSYFETPVRALSGVSNTRTWNLMIDIVAQSGRMSPSAKTLADFTVEGERRYWLHVAIDRYTGRIIEQQLEPVTE